MRILCFFFFFFFCENVLRIIAKLKYCDRSKLFFPVHYYLTKLKFVYFCPFMKKYEKCTYNIHFFHTFDQSPPLQLFLIDGNGARTANRRLQRSYVEAAASKTFLNSFLLKEFPLSNSKI